VTVKQARELGFDAHLIGSKLQYWDKLEKEEQDLEQKILELERNKEILEHQFGYDDSG
jgi:hypothetical protein